MKEILKIIASIAASIAIIIAAYIFSSKEIYGLASFGGTIQYVEYCCNGIMLTIGSPKGGNYILAPGSLVFPFGQVYRAGAWALGDAIPGGVCATVSSECEVSVPAAGTIRMIGTSL